MTVQDLLEIRNCLSISRHDPGRLDLKISLSILQCRAARELAALGRGCSSPALLDASFNFFGRSASLRYDAELVSPGDIDRFFNSDSPEELGGLAVKVAGLFGVDLNLA